MCGSALKGRAVFEGERQAAIRVGRGVVQQATPELLAEGGDLAVLLFQNPEEVLHRAAPVSDVADLLCDRILFRPSPRSVCTPSCYLTKHAPLDRLDRARRLGHRRRLAPP